MTEINADPTTVRPGAHSRAPFVQSSLFGGTGDVLIWDLLGRQSAPPFSAALRCELAPGGLVGAHRQEHHPEIIIGLSGTGTATVDGTPHDLVSGSLVHLALGSVLKIANNSNTEPLGYFIIKATG